MRRPSLVRHGQRAVQERIRRQHRISFEIVGALPVLHLNFKLLVPSPVPLVPIGANVHTVKKVLLLPALSIACAVVVRMTSTKRRMIILARLARLGPNVVLARNRRRHLQFPVIAVAVIVYLESTRRMVLLLEPVAVSVQRVLSSNLRQRHVLDVREPRTKIKIPRHPSLVHHIQCVNRGNTRTLSPVHP